MSVNISLALNGYTINNGAISVSSADEFKIYIGGNLQTLNDASQIIPDFNMASLGIDETDDTGYLEIRVIPAGQATEYLAFTQQGTSYQEAYPDAFIDGNSSFVGTSTLFGAPFINPDFQIVVVEGCATDNPGPFPDKNGFCRPLPNGDERLPNSLGYCKYGNQTNIVNIDQFDGQAIASSGDQNNYGYSVCNFDPLANTDDGSCVTRANATPLTYSVQNPWDLSNPDQQQDETKCDCFGNTFDCDDTCLSQHSAGVCSDQYLSSYWQNEDFGVYSTQGNGVGCGILACNGNCISPDTWINIFNDAGANGVCDFPELFGCSGENQFQGYGHPLIDEGYVDGTTGKANFQCEFNNCLDCAGGCADSQADLSSIYTDPTTGELTTCGECVGGESSNASVFPCSPPWYDGELTEWTCLDGWSQDAFGNCPDTLFSEFYENGNPGDMDWSVINDYHGPCYGFSVEDILEQVPEGMCGYDCNGEPGGIARYFTCGGSYPCGEGGCALGGNIEEVCSAIPAGECDCDGNVLDCNNDCVDPESISSLLTNPIDGDNQPFGLDHCGDCYGNRFFYTLYGDSIEGTECTANSGGDCTLSDGVTCDCNGNILDCEGTCGGDVVVDECGECGGNGEADLGCGCFEDGPSGCDNTCGSELTYDDCQGIIPDGESCGGLNYFYCNDDTSTPCNPSDDSNCPGECTLLGSDICDCLGNIYDCNDVCGGDSFIDSCTVCRPGNYIGDSETDGGNILGHDSNGFPLCDPDGDGILQPCCDCAGTLQQLWCYDGDGDGDGCQNCSDPATEPRYACSDPSNGATHNTEPFNPFWTTNCTDTDDSCFCQDEVGNAIPATIENGCLNNCGVCAAADEVECENGDICCGGELYCDCNNACTNNAPSANHDENFRDCNDDCYGTAIIDECGVCSGGNTGLTPNIDKDCHGNCPDCDDGTTNNCIGGSYLGSDGAGIDCNGDCGGDAVIDECGVCDGDNQDKDDCGVCFGNVDIVDPCVTGETNGEQCQCADSDAGIQAAFCDECGVCGGDGTQQYYYDEDGDGLICSDTSEPIDLCPNNPVLQTQCGPGGGNNPDGLCYVPKFDLALEDFEEQPECGCPYAYDGCGRCIESGGGTQPICEYENDYLIPQCATEDDYYNYIENGGPPCNSLYCKTEDYNCVQSPCDMNYYVFERLQGFGGLVTIANPSTQMSGTDFPVDDGCDTCIAPMCSGWFDLPTDMTWPILPNVGTNPCNEQLLDQNGNPPVPTNSSWNALCTDCAGDYFGNNRLNCDGDCVDYNAEVLGNGICDLQFACGEIDQGFFPTIDFQCDGGDCLDCAGQCLQGGDEGYSYLQQNLDGLYCGCSSEVLVNNVGCCTTGFAYTDATLETVAGEDYGTPDCHTPQSCMTQDVFDCAGVCGGTNYLITCCNGIEYCLEGDQTCVDVVACGCYSNPSACNYNPLGLSELELTDIEQNYDLYEVGNYACVNHTSSFYYPINEETGFVDLDNPVELCGIVPEEEGQCCDCPNENGSIPTYDCDLSCLNPGEGTRPQQWYQDPDCDGFGTNGTLTNEFYCIDDLPDTLGCWSLVNGDLDAYCLKPQSNGTGNYVYWTSNVPSTPTGDYNQMLPTEPEICKAVDETDSIAVFACAGIGANETDCMLPDSEGNNICKWEKDYFFGVDDCGQCWRTGLGDEDVNLNFNKFGTTSKDCNGCCQIGTSMDGSCGALGDETGCVDGSPTDCNFNGTDEGNGPGFDQCNVCNGNGQSCVECLHPDASNYNPYEGALSCDYGTNADGSIPGEYDCCNWNGTEDCMQLTPLQNQITQCGSAECTDWNAAVYDRCGICSGGTSGITPNTIQSCNCCAEEDNPILNGLNIDSSFTEFGMCTEDGINYETVEEYSNYNSTLEDWYEDYIGLQTGPFQDCLGYCHGNYIIDHCNRCTDPSAAYMNTPDPGYNSGTYLQCDCPILNGDEIGTRKFWDDCGQCNFPSDMLANRNYNSTNPSYSEGLQCACENGAQEFWTYCGECLPSDRNPTIIQDCNGNCGNPGDATFAYEDEHPNPNINGTQCCTADERDDCGVCFGDNLDVGCDGVCFSGNILQPCGCGQPGTQQVSLHCQDSDGDGLGNQNVASSICSMDTESPGLLPTNWPDVPGEGIYLFDVNDEFPAYVPCPPYDDDDTCAGQFDDCGICITETMLNDGYVPNSSCTGCNDESACNYGMNQIGTMCPTIPCEFEDNFNTCISTEPCQYCNEDESLQFCPPEYCSDNCESDICPIEENYLCTECNDDKNSYCPGENPNDVCYFIDDCGICSEGFENTDTGSWSCDECTDPENCDNCDCAGCMDDSCPGYDVSALYPIATGGYNTFCEPIACSGICGGSAVVDDCGTCVCEGDDPNEAEGCVDEEYNNADYNCGCVNQQPWSDNWEDVGDYCDDGQYPPLGCPPTNGVWLGCQTCNIAPDLCGNCPETNWGGCGSENCACSGCGIEGACNYEPDAIVRDDELCLWYNAPGPPDPITGDLPDLECVCILPWTDGDWIHHNEYCQDGSWFYDQCGTPFLDVNDPLFNDCAGCPDPDSLNYNPNAGVYESCFYGDLAIIPSSEDGYGINNYTFRPFGDDDFGTQCDEGNPNFGTCNDNFGGIEVIATNSNGTVGGRLNVKQYNIRITDSNGIVKMNAYANDNGEVFNNIESGDGDYDYMNPDCPIGGTFDQGTKNIFTLISCGVGYTFSYDDTYTVECTITDSQLNSFTITKELIVNQTIGWGLSVRDYYEPYRGMNIPEADILSEEFKYTKQDFKDFDLDKRPSLGTFYFSDDPNSSGLISSGNLDEDGYYISYYSDKHTISGKKWGGNIGIGKEYEGLLPNIENECGVDRGIINNVNSLTSSPTSDISNKVCLNIGITDNDWSPDILAYTERALQSERLSGTRSRLWEYYDKDIDTDKYYETTGPLEAILYFQPADYTDSIFSDRPPVALISENPHYITNINWGDGQIEFEKEIYNLLDEGQKLTHSYTKPGVYEITGYWFSVFRNKTCVFVEGGAPDGRNWLCNNDSHCNGYCNNGRCSGGDNDGNTCQNNNECQEAGNVVKCSDDIFDLGVDKFYKFTLRISVNEEDGFSEHPYIINETNLEQVVISGLSKNSIYYKNILRQLGYLPELPEEEPLDLYFQFYYDKLMTQYALAQMDENLIGEDLQAFMTPVDDEFGNRIFNGRYLDGHGETGKYIGNTDIGQLRYFNLSISMAEMLGFRDEDGGDPSNEVYWKNIIPQDYFIGDRTGLEYDEDDLISVNASDIDGQIWIGQNEYGNDYYYPVLPKLNVYGEFVEVDGPEDLQGFRRPFGTPGREWNEVDEALITSLTTNDFNKYLLIDIDFSSEDDGKLQDISGNGNDAFLINDYRIDYEQGTRIPEKQDSPSKARIDISEKQF